MIVKLNGVALTQPVMELKPYTMTVEDVVQYIEDSNMKKKDYKRLKRLCMWLWTVSGSMFMQTTYAAANAVPSSTNLWLSLSPVFGILQQIAMSIGAFALIFGLICMIFKRRLGIQIIGTAAMVIGGIFLVPSVVMLVAIVGNLLDGALSEAFSHIGGSVKIK